jgi:hypothetical protein
VAVEASPAEWGALLRVVAMKKSLCSNRTYLKTFLLETCRWESARWVMMSAAPFFFLWNPLRADGVMCLYVVSANLPCIITQRYNCKRLRRIVRA